MFSSPPAPPLTLPGLLTSKASEILCSFLFFSQKPKPNKTMVSHKMSTSLKDHPCNIQILSCFFCCDKRPPLTPGPRHPPALTSFKSLLTTKRCEALSVVASSSAPPVTLGSPPPNQEAASFFPLRYIYNLGPTRTCKLQHSYNEGRLM